MCETAPVPDSTRQGPWLFGAVPDLLLGCGLAYIAVYAVFSLGGEPFRQAQPALVIPLLSVLLSGPHYGATLLRVYERGEDRSAHRLVAVWSTLLVVGLFSWSIHDVVVASWFFTVFITWSPWHYTSQNFGVSMMFLRRAGVAPTLLARRLLRASFLCSFLVTFLVLHALPEASRYNPNPLDYDSSIVGQSLGIPMPLAKLAIAAALVVCACATAAAFALIARAGSPRALLPVAGIVLTQTLWFTIPFSVQFFGIRTGFDTMDSGLSEEHVFWTAIGHALQYQFVTTYFARASTGWRGYGAYLGKCLAAGAAVWTLPAVVFAPDLIGDREFTAGLGVMVATAVNLHHFILDGAIWKLRSRRVADVLIRSVHEAPTAELRRPRRWPMRALWATCGALAAIRIGMVGMEQIAFPSALRAADFTRADSLLDALSWLGRDSSRRRTALAGALARSGDADGTEAQLRRSAELADTRRAWTQLARFQGRRGDWEGVVETYQVAHALPPDASTRRLPPLAMRAYYATQQPDRARAVLDEVAALPGGPDAKTYAAMGRAALEASDPEPAIRAYRQALRIEPGRHAAANDLAWILATAEPASLRDPGEAVALAEAAVAASDPVNLDYLDTLATALAAAGRFDDAVATRRRALDAALERGDDAGARTARVSLEQLLETLARAPAGQEPREGARGS
jgi:tetratricopeptide (TPR) repeat protein